MTHSRENCSLASFFVDPPTESWRQGC